MPGLPQRRLSTLAAVVAAQPLSLGLNLAERALKGGQSHASISIGHRNNALAALGMGSGMIAHGESPTLHSKALNLWISALCPSAIQWIGTATEGECDDVIGHAIRSVATITDNAALRAPRRAALSALPLWMCCRRKLAAGWDDLLAPAAALCGAVLAAGLAPGEDDGGVSGFLGLAGEIGGYKSLVDGQQCLDASLPGMTHPGLVVVDQQYGSGQGDPAVLMRSLSGVELLVDATDVLQGCLQHSDPAVRAAGAGALARVKDRAKEVVFTLVGSEMGQMVIDSALKGKLE
eukprot:gnl/Dysnectes_brevis/7201_a11851_219.p1 GENE.gnl/Dysnectes_brevis/7201_a11851_219~~gnl/Dysnectes_brevis/7201_a11851_219.p1  ORF type:complete len:291 (-),score=45.71 gnl/Dysnectes_brevis/7201_a11851_219:31-903(-)